MGGNFLFARRQRDPFKGLLAHTKKEGGATVDPKTGEHYDASKGGYAVGLFDDTAVKVPAKARSRQHTAAMRKVSNVPGATHMGTWLNKDVIHYDPVEIVPDLETAKAKGRERKQKAIYDFANDKEIEL